MQLVHERTHLSRRQPEHVAVSQVGPGGGSGDLYRDRGRCPVYRVHRGFRRPVDLPSSRRPLRGSRDPADGNWSVAGGFRRGPASRTAWQRRAQGCVAPDPAPCRNRHTGGRSGGVRRPRAARAYPGHRAGTGARALARVGLGRAREVALRAGTERRPVRGARGAVRDRRSGRSATRPLARSPGAFADHAPARRRYCRTHRPMRSRSNSGGARARHACPDLRLATDLAPGRSIRRAVDRARERKARQRATGLRPGRAGVLARTRRETSLECRRRIRMGSVRILGRAAARGRFRADGAERGRASGTAGGLSRTGGSPGISAIGPAVDPERARERHRLGVCPRGEVAAGGRGLSAFGRERRARLGALADRGGAPASSGRGSAHSARTRSAALVPPAVCGVSAAGAESARGPCPLCAGPGQPVRSTNRSSRT